MDDDVGFEVMSARDMEVIEPVGIDCNDRDPYSGKPCQLRPGHKERHRWSLGDSHWAEWSHD